MKLFVSDSAISIILKAFLLLFPICVIVSSIIQSLDSGVFIYVICITIVLDIGFFLLMFSHFGFIIFKKDIVIVSQDMTIKTFRIQHKFKVKMDEIAAIEFLEEDCTSIGGEICWRYFGIPPFLKVYKKDNSVDRIFLGKYSYRTWKKIEKQITNFNTNVVVLTDASTFKYYLKTGMNKKR